MTPPSEAAFTSIRVSTLRGDLKIPFDVYVKVGGKQILYCRRGDSFEGARLERLKSKKLRKIFIRPEEESRYRQYLQESLEAAYSVASPKPLALRVEVIQGYQQAAAEDYIDDPLNEFSYKTARESIHRFTGFLEQSPQALRAILQLQNIDHSITHHGLAVAALSVTMARDRGLGDRPLPLLALGGLVHDLEHFYNSVDFEVPVSAMTLPERMEYERHPLAGAHRLERATFVDQLVFQVVTQHEETMDQSGFPKKLSEREMDPLVMIAATANAYERRVSFEGKPPKEALKTLLIEKMGVYPLPLLQSLQNILKRNQIL